MAIFFRQARAIFQKDLLTEWRGKEMIGSMLIFGLLVIVVFSFAFEPDEETTAAMMPGLLWISFHFSATLGLNRSFAGETRLGALQGLLIAPMDRSALYLGKVAANFAFMLSADVILLACFTILYNFSIIPVLGRLLLTIFLGTLGFAVVGTLFAAVALNTRMSEVLLPILQLPITVPLMIAAIEATEALVRPESGGHFGDWMQMLIAFDILFFVLCLWLFEYVIEE
jgi:heme exporter protein B